MMVLPEKLLIYIYNFKPVYIIYFSAIYVSIKRQLKNL